MPIRVWTSDGHDFTLQDATSLDETSQKLREAMEGGTVTDLYLQGDELVLFNGRHAGWAVVFDDQGQSSKPAVADLTTMIMGGNGGTGPA
jgi:hypothetical protein